MACTSCQGKSCSNVESPTIDDTFDINEPTCDTSLLAEFTCTQDEDEPEENEQGENLEEEEQGENREEFENYDSD